MREHESALAEAQKMIDLTPNLALAYFVLGAIIAALNQMGQIPLEPPNVKGWPDRKSVV